MNTKINTHKQYYELIDWEIKYPTSEDIYQFKNDAETIIHMYMTGDNWIYTALYS